MYEAAQLTVPPHGPRNSLLERPDQAHSSDLVGKWYVVPRRGKFNHTLQLRAQPWSGTPSVLVTVRPLVAVLAGY